MRYIVAALLITLGVFSGSMYAKSYKPVIVSVDEIPADVEGFLQLRNELSVTPEGGAVVMLVALMKLSQDKEMGLKFMVIALDRSNLKSGNVYRDFAPGRGLEYHIARFTEPKRKHIPFAYIIGATPENNYEVPFPYKFKTTRNKSSQHKDGTIKVFVTCYGTSWPRPVTLKKNSKGLWKAKELSSLFLDVVGPARDTRVDDDI